MGKGKRKNLKTTKIPVMLKNENAPTPLATRELGWQTRERLMQNSVSGGGGGVRDGWFGAEKGSEAE